MPALLYVVSYTNGRSPTRHATYSDAIAECTGRWPGAEVGHSGDLRSGGDRTLVWAGARDDVYDDGTRAVADISVDIDAAHAVVWDLAWQDAAREDEIPLVAGVDAVNRWVSGAAEAGDRGVVEAIDALGIDAAGGAYDGAVEAMRARRGVHPRVTIRNAR